MASVRFGSSRHDCAGASRLFPLHRGARETEVEYQVRGMRMPAAIEQPLSNSAINVRIKSIVLTAAVLLVTAMLAAPASRAQTLSILHAFTNGGDGGTPFAGLTPDQFRRRKRARHGIQADTFGIGMDIEYAVQLSGRRRLLSFRQSGIRTRRRSVRHNCQWWLPKPWDCVQPQASVQHLPIG